MEKTTSEGREHEHYSEAYRLVEGAVENLAEAAVPEQEIVDLITGWAKQRIGLEA